MSLSATEEMETLAAAMRRLEGAGFDASFTARPEGLLDLDTNRLYRPEELVVDEIVRFEGDSDPQDQAVLFALHSSDGRARGTFVATYGASTDPLAAEMMKRLDAPAVGRHRVQ